MEQELALLRPSPDADSPGADSPAAACSLANVLASRLLPGNRAGAEGAEGGAERCYASPRGEPLELLLQHIDEAARALRAPPQPRSP